MIQSLPTETQGSYLIKMGLFLKNVDKRDPMWIYHILCVFIPRTQLLPIQARH